MASEMLKKALIVSAEKEFDDIYSESVKMIWNPSPRFTSEISELIRKSERRKLKGFKKVALIAAVIVLISVMAVFSFAQVRNTVINSFRKIYATHFILEYGVDEAGDINKLQNMDALFTLSALPSDFELVSADNNGHSAVTIWENEKEETLIFAQGDGISKRSIDNERLEEQIVFDNDIEYRIFSEDGYMFVMWATAEYTFSIDYFGEKSADDLIKIAGSVCEEE